MRRLKTNTIFTFILLFVVSSMTIGYSALSQNLTISGEAKYHYFDPLATNTILALVGNASTTSTDVITVDPPSNNVGLFTGPCTNTLAYDGTSDKNLRYVGAEPCNYVTFNNQMWRIIGVMKNVDNGGGTKETRLKIMKYTSLGFYSWDSSDTSINSGYGINDWVISDLKTELNGDYLNTTATGTTLWYNSYGNYANGLYNYSDGLTSEAQALISNAKWNLGGVPSNYTSAGTPSTLYSNERGTTVWGSTSGQTCNDGACPRTTKWTGKVGLFYPSDYAFSTAGGSTTNRATCLQTAVYNWDRDSTTTNDCVDSTWLKGIPQGTNQTANTQYIYTISPYAGSYNKAMTINKYGSASTATVSSASVVTYPTVYLKASVYIVGGTGTYNEPYLLSNTRP